MTLLHLLTYLSFLTFIVMVIAKIIRISSTPIHLRWELYPVPHEKGRAHYGGSRLEEVDWWEKKSEKDHLGELKVMIPEIILLKGVWDHNKELWIGSFPFHFALYLFSANIFLFIIAAVFTLSGSPVTSDSIGIQAILFWLIFLITWLGAVIGVIGSGRLFFHRLTDTGLRKYSNPSHYFNILLIGAIFLTAFIWLLTDSNMIPKLTGYYSGIITFASIPEIPLVGSIHIITSLVFLLYLPFTHMTHFFMKYFTYHKVRWEDTPNMNNEKMQAEISKVLNQPVTWAAPHIGADGRKNWLAIVTDIPFIPKEKKDE